MAKKTAKKAGAKKSAKKPAPITTAERMAALDARLSRLSGEERRAFLERGVKGLHRFKRNENGNVVIVNPATKPAKKPKKAAAKKPAAKKPKKAAAKKPAAKKPEAASKRPMVSWTVQVKENPTVIRRGESLVKRALGATPRVHKLDAVNLSDGQRSRVKLVSVKYQRGGETFIHRPKDASVFLYGAQVSGATAEKSPRVERMPIGSVEWGRVEEVVVAAGGKETTLSFPAGSRPLVLVAPNAKAYWIAHTTETYSGAPAATKVMLVRRSGGKVASARGLID